MKAALYLFPGHLACSPRICTAVQYAAYEVQSSWKYKKRAKRYKPGEGYIKEHEEYKACMCL